MLRAVDPELMTQRVISAIIKVYPSFESLCQGYLMCKSRQDAQLLIYNQVQMGLDDDLMQLVEFLKDISDETDDAIEAQPPHIVGRNKQISLKCYKCFYPSEDILDFL